MFAWLIETKIAIRAQAVQVRFTFLYGAEAVPMQNTLSLFRIHMYKCVWQKCHFCVPTQQTPQPRPYRQQDLTYK